MSPLMPENYPSPIPPYEHQGARSVSNMKVLVTLPGRFGDILWAMPTARAIAEHYGTRVDLMISPEFASIKPLVEAQPYIRSLIVNPNWVIQASAPMGPATAPLDSYPAGWSRVYHLAGRSWPAQSIPLDFAERAGFKVEMERPWVHSDNGMWELDCVAVCWSEEWLELKMGIIMAVAPRFPQTRFLILHRPGGRHEEWAYTPMPQNVQMVARGWVGSARVIARSSLYLGCLSSLWVIANGLGKRCLVVEPAPQRHDPVFWLDSERNSIVKGRDGMNSFDARLVREALEGVIG